MLVVGLQKGKNYLVVLFIHFYFRQNKKSVKQIFLNDYAKGVRLFRNFPFNDIPLMQLIVNPILNQ